MTDERGFSLMRDYRSFLAPLFYAHFLRLRYYLSPPTRQAFGWVSAQIDHGINNPNCPAPVKRGVTLVRDLVNEKEALLELFRLTPT